ncbi:MAG TPA: uracil-DNA glycosylase [Paraburkholderia sp.]|uniref:uracil-DNA glycosylase n=1 Tax=Paraburkholderia sp. TaxID=1926495 RepID=UPI002CDEC96D|nr:uracil-DNA glycosylase [Paraburkholderia sp.]HTR05734.1 uracil-DNA glycosylase [Paraburkholderia sp.]
MPLDEIALEELGLAPRWVRKGTQGVAKAVQAPREEEPGMPAPARAAAPEMLRGESETPVEQAQRAVAAPLANVARETIVRAAGSDEPLIAASAAETQPARAEPSPPAQAASPAAKPTALSSDEPPPFTEDDFAWFDSVAQPVLPHDAVPAQTAGASGNDIATLDWDALAERVASCTRCRLCEKRTNTVFGVGDREADWMLIGEAPGENEDRLGEPFVGQAGKLLDNMLRALSLARGENVYIANVIKCRPPGNRNPEPDEVARCEPYLQRQVALVKPKIIVALGRFAAQSLLKTDGSIASLRGRVHEYEGVPVIVTYHPAYLLRSLQDKAKAWADLCLARDTWRAASGGEQ